MTETKNIMKKLKLAFLATMMTIGCSAQGYKSDHSHAQETSDNPALTETPEAKKQYHDFIMQVGNEIIRILAQKNQSMTVRKAEFKTILLKYFNMPAIAEVVLGTKIWGELSPEQRKDYTHLFEQAVVENYAAKFNNYNNQKLEVKRIVANVTPNESVVYSNIVQPNGAVFHKIEWTISNHNKVMQVSDIKIEGISMCRTLSTDYRGVYKRGGFTALRTYLNSRISNPTPGNSNTNGTQE